MTRVKFPYNFGAAKATNSIELIANDEELVNGYISIIAGERFTRIRPGTSRIYDFAEEGEPGSAPVSGLFWWQSKKKIVCVVFGTPYFLSRQFGQYIASKASSSPILNPFGVCSIIGTEDYVFVCNGGKIYYSDGVTDFVAMSDVNAPTTVSSLGYLDGYLLATGDGTNRFYWSDVGSMTSWSGDYASASGDTDILVALKVFERQIYLFGTTTFEVWQNDGATPFSRVPGGFFQVGCGARNSIVSSGQSLYWVSDSKRIVVYRNGTIEGVSSHYDFDILKYVDISDCVSYVLNIEGKSFLLFNFIAAGKTLVFDEVEGLWGEWNNLNETGEEIRWNGGVGVYNAEWNLNIIGGISDCSLSILRSDFYSDNDSPIRLRKLTGHLDGGTLQCKRLNEFCFRVLRGAVDIGREPKLLLRWKDDGQRLSQWREISLGNLGETRGIISLKSLGMFRTRQFEFIVSDPIPFTMGEAEGDVTILGG